MTRGKRARLMMMFLSTDVRNAGVLLFLLCPKASTDGKDSTMSATIPQAAVMYAAGSNNTHWVQRAVLSKHMATPPPPLLLFRPRQGEGTGLQPAAQLQMQSALDAQVILRACRFHRRPAY